MYGLVGLVRGRAGQGGIYAGYMYMYAVLRELLRGIAGCGLRDMIVTCTY